MQIANNNFDPFIPYFILHRYFLQTYLIWHLLMGLESTQLVKLKKKVLYSKESTKEGRDSTQNHCPGRVFPVFPIWKITVFCRFRILCTRILPQNIKQYPSCLTASPSTQLLQRLNMWINIMHLPTIFNSTLNTFGTSRLLPAVVTAANCCFCCNAICALYGAWKAAFLNAKSN